MMAKDEILAVKDAVHKVQLFLLEGVRHENQLGAAGSLISQSDYQDVVTERTLANMCGYPLCSNSLLSERPWKGNYHVSLKEHKVYDLQETYKYCSNGCLINSRAFFGCLHEERCSTLSPAKLNEVLKLFEGLSSNNATDMGKSGELGLTELRIVEKKDAECGEVSLEEWLGPPNAIEGYVPLRDPNLISEQSNNLDGVIYERFEENCISKTVPPVKAEKPKGKTDHKEVNDLSSPMQKQNAHLGSRGAGSKMFHRDNNSIKTDDKFTILQNPPGPSQNNQNRNATRSENRTCSRKDSKGGTSITKSSLKTSDSKKAPCSVTWADEKTVRDVANNVFNNTSIIKSSLKTSDSKKSPCSVTWADEKTVLDVANNVRVEVKSNEEAVAEPYSAGKELVEDSYRFASAEACAMALSQAAADVESGKMDSSVAASEADVLILPPPHGMNEAKSLENGSAMDTNTTLPQWSGKQAISNGDPFDSENSWYDSPPEGFNLALSSFSTMFMALFAWISSSSLAYIYGRDQSYHEDYLFVNGREYPRKIFMPDGRSSEIKLTLAGCLSRALPGLLAEFRLPTPVSTLEQGLGHLLDTMSFLDALPPFRMHQWKLVLLLFLDALSVSQIPELSPYMMGRRILLPKVLEGAQISAEEYEIMKDVLMPLGRVPQLSTQSGG